MSTELQKEEQAAASRMVFQPRTDIRETDAAYEIVADVPGADRDGVEVTVDSGVLSIRGRVQDRSAPERQPAYAEFLVGDYRRDITLPENVEAEKIEASVKDGVLRLTLPKRAPAQAKRIAIKAA